MAISLPGTVREVHVSVEKKNIEDEKFQSVPPDPFLQELPQAKVEAFQLPDDGGHICPYRSWFYYSGKIAQLEHGNKTLKYLLEAATLVSWH